MRKKLKVVYVITGLNAGGVEHMLLRSVKETAGSIESVVVSLTDLGVVGAQLKELGVKVYTLEMGGNPLRALKLFGIFRRERPDVVQCKMYHALRGIGARYLRRLRLSSGQIESDGKWL